VCWKHICAYRNHTLHVGITLERVEITLVSVIFTRILSCVSKPRVKSHSECGNRTLRVENNLVRVEITLVRVIITLTRVKITLCV
jgi:hypothetical protein